MAETKERGIVGDIGAALFAGLKEVSGDIGQAYQEVLLQDSPVVAHKPLKQDDPAKPAPAGEVGLTGEILPPDFDDDGMVGLPYEPTPLLGPPDAAEPDLD